MRGHPVNFYGLFETRRIKNSVSGSFFMEKREFFYLG